MLVMKLLEFPPLPLNELQRTRCLLLVLKIEYIICSEQRGKARQEVGLNTLTHNLAFNSQHPVPIRQSVS